MQFRFPKLPYDFRISFSACFDLLPLVEVIVDTYRLGSEESVKSHVHVSALFITLNWTREPTDAEFQLYNEGRMF